MPYTVGSLVRARGREWVVLPDSTAEWLVLRPLGGTEDEIALHLVRFNAYDYNNRKH